MGCNDKYFFEECRAPTRYSANDCMRLVSQFVVSVYNVEHFLRNLLQYQVCTCLHISSWLFSSSDVCSRVIRIPNISMKS